MCEPHHSVVQYPDDYDDTNLPFGGNMDKESRLKSALGKAFGWTRKFGKWFHLSKFGAGHSRPLVETHRTTMYLPDHIKYEGAWWNREFEQDRGWSSLDPIAAIDEMKAAKDYHRASVIGNMSLFRRFLETSMLKTQHPYGAYVYVEKLLEYVLTPGGQNDLLKRLRSVLTRGWKDAFQRHSNPQDLEKGIKVVMGFTRKRKLFLPHFAEDASLWLPGGKAEG